MGGRCPCGFAFFLGWKSNDSLGGGIAGLEIVMKA